MIEIRLQSKMIEFGVAVLSLLIGVNATLNCITFRDDLKIKCFPDDNNDYVLNKELLKEILLSYQDKVVAIDLESCSITEIQCDAFSNLPALRVLNLSDNKLHELKPCVVNNLHQLTVLYLSNNKISGLSSDTFAQRSNLSILNLGGNRLKTLQPDVFDRLIKLDTLTLNNNSIDGKILSPRIFANNTIMRVLNIYWNNMSAAPEDLLQSFQRLHNLVLVSCFLMKVPSFATKSNLKTLMSLILSHNQISSLDDPKTFISLEELTNLDLGYNLIEHIADNVFTPLRKLRTIVLRHNKLKTISGRLFQDMPNLLNIHLSYNDIEEINLDSFRNTPIEYLDLARNRMSYMPVNFYDTIIMSGGNLVTFFFNDNPWQCACLREIFQEVKRTNLRYNSWVYDGKMPVCLDTDDDFTTCKRG